MPGLGCLSSPKAGAGGNVGVKTNLHKRRRALGSTWSTCGVSCAPLGQVDASTQVALGARVTCLQSYQKQGFSQLPSLQDSFESFL